MGPSESTSAKLTLKGSSTSYSGPSEPRWPFQLVTPPTCPYLAPIIPNCPPRLPAHHQGCPYPTSLSTWDAQAPPRRSEGTLPIRPSSLGFPSEINPLLAALPVLTPYFTCNWDDYDESDNNEE